MLKTFNPWLGKVPNPVIQVVQAECLQILPSSTSIYQCSCGRSGIVCSRSWYSKNALEPMIMKDMAFELTNHHWFEGIEVHILWSTERLIDLPKNSTVASPQHCAAHQQLLGPKWCRLLVHGNVSIEVLKSQQRQLSWKRKTLKIKSHQQLIFLIKLQVFWPKIMTKFLFWCFRLSFVQGSWMLPLGSSAWISTFILAKPPAFCQVSKVNPWKCFWVSGVSNMNQSLGKPISNMKQFHFLISFPIWSHLKKLYPNE